MSSNKKENKTEQEQDGFVDFPLDVKRNIIDIINDSPSIVRLGDKEYTVKGLRYYSVNRIFRLALDMRKADETLDTDQKVITALCTDLDAMCEIMAIILCNHLFSPDDVRSYKDVGRVETRNDKWVAIMKSKVMYSTFDTSQWAAIVLGAIKSIDLSGFFLLKKSVNMVMDSHLTRKKKSEETASLFMEALSLQMQQTSSARSHNTD